MTHLPLTSELLELICARMDVLIHSVVAARSSGQLDEPGLVEALLCFETESATAHGLILSASHTFDDWTVVSLRSPDQRAPCRSFEFHAASGQFRRVGTPCREGEPSVAERRRSEQG